MKTFMVIWFGQFISMLGSALSAFGLGIWIFQKTGSAASFAMSAVCTVLPALLFAPFAGSIADRKKRKAIILLTDSIDAFLKILIVTLLIFNKLELWMVYPLVFISGTLGAFQNPAFGASIPMLVPSDKLTRANGLLQFSSAIQNLLAPVIAGFLYPLIELKELFIIDFVSFFFALASIAFIKIPQPSIEKTKDSLVLAAFKDLQYAWKYLIQKEGLMQLIVFFAFLNFIANLSMILLGPLMMSVYNSKAYGNVQAGIGLAMLLGGLCSSLIPDTKNKIKRILLILSLCSIGPIISGTTLNRIIITGGFFIFMFPVPYVNTLLMSIFQIKIERVGALMTAILAAITPIAYLCAGPLADYVFEPLMNEKGRGIGLIFIISGILLIISCLLMRLNKTVTSIEKRLPDYVDNQ